jgi:TBC1 domain-containing protein 4
VRQAMFLSVTSPGARPERDYRLLWRQAIRCREVSTLHSCHATRQQLLLLQMERAEVAAEKEVERRAKLDYSELVPVTPSTLAAWDRLLGPDVAPDRAALAHAVTGGVPTGQRGEVWKLLAAASPASPPALAQFPALATSYQDLKARLAVQQHAILIDIGRTFPSHSYFRCRLSPPDTCSCSGALGHGQLGLFNLLKAYRFGSCCPQSSPHYSSPPAC